MRKMIAISEQPKRFVAALNKFRVIINGTGRSSFPAIVSLRPLNYNKTTPRYFSTSPVKDSPAFTPPVILEKSGTEATVRQERDIFHTAFSSTKENNQGTKTTALKLTGPRDAKWYTGKPPVHGVCPGVAKDGWIYSLPLVTADPVTRKWSKKALRDYFDNTWTITEVLLGSLQGEEAFIRSPYHELRHPMIFYYGHPAVLYINKFRVAGLIKDPLNPYFESIFETGVDEMSWDDLSKNKMAWPSVAEVREYRAKVYQIVTNVIDQLTEEQLSATGPESSLWALLMGMEHERIHIETSSVLINELPLRYVRFPEGMPAYHPSTTKESPLEPIAGKDYPINDMIPVPAQRVALGKPKDMQTFGWDNEYGYREYDIPAFHASKYKITNGEFLEFVKDNGYARPELWTESGWKWRAFRNVKWPTFWIRKGPQGHHQYDLRLLFDVVPMQWNWPACVNYHEAAAFAKWKSMKSGKSYRILTELEHRAIRNPSETGAAGDYAMKYSGYDMAKAGYNTNMAYSSMTPVDLYPPNEKGFHDVFGNAWEWTEDYFCALPGFEIHPYYEDFSTPCFDGLHHVIQGGSFISTGDEASIHSRYHFRPHFFQHASFRVVESSEEMITSDLDAPGPFVGSYPFRRSQAKLMEQAKRATAASGEMGLTVPQMLAKHYGLKEGFDRPLEPLTKAITNFIHQELTSSEMLAKGKLIEVGCGPGGLTFPLLAHFQTVIGIDHHQSLVDIAKQLLKGEEITYPLPDQGELVTSQVVTMDSTIATQKRIEFRCADPMCLPAELNHFDCVILHDILDQMSAPNSVLGRLGGVRGLVRPGGVVIVISAFQWSEDRTPKSLWLGGVLADAAHRSEVQLSQKLAMDDFEEKFQMKIPITWHETTANLRGKVYTVMGYKRMK